MKTSILFSTLLFLLMVISCDDCNLFPPVTEYEVGDTLWIHEIPGKDSLRIDNSLALGKDGSLYYAVGGGTWSWQPTKVIALNKENGTIKWESEKMDNIGLNSEIVVGDDGTVYAIGRMKLYAFNPDNGSTKWIWEVPETLPAEGYPNGVFSKGDIGRLALTKEGNLICGSIGGGIYSRAIYCIGKNGQKIWHNRDATSTGISSPISVGKNNVAYYYSEVVYENIDKRSLVAVDLATGNIKWKLPISASGGYANNIAIKDDGNLFCAFTAEGENETKYRIIDGSNGNTLWTSTELGSPYNKWIGTDGSLYVYDNGWTHLLNPINGTKTKVVDKGINFGCISEDNRIVCGFTDFDWKRKLAVFYKDGLMDFSVPMDGLEGSTLVISDKKVVYAIINLHPVSRLPTKICAIQGKSKLAGSGWPRISHDNRNTFNAGKF